MSEMIDIETIYRQERQRWFREEAPRRSLRDVIAGSVPYWIIVTTPPAKADGFSGYA